jgi:hypothetical protein
MVANDAKLRLGLTDAGKILLGGTGFVFLAAMIIPAFGVLAALVAVIASALLVGFVLRPRVEIVGDLPDRVVAGQVVRLSYTLKNTARVPAYNLTLHFGTLTDTIEQLDAEHRVPSLAPGETTEVTIVIRPNRRGRHRIKPPVCESSFPFNLFSFGLSRSGDQTLTVLPAFYRLPVAFGRRRRHVHSGHAGFAGRTEVSPEYAGNRPFLPGDSPRRIDVRAWARLSVPATKEYHNNLDSYAALILDTRVPKSQRPANSTPIKELEAAVSLCASLAFTIDHDCLTDLLLAGPELHPLTSWPAMTRLDRIHDVLAGVEASEGYDLERALPVLAERFQEVSDVILVLRTLDATYLQLLEYAARAGCHSTVFLIGGSDSTSAGERYEQWADSTFVLSPDEILAGPIERL